MDANERSVQIELDSKNKIISVPRQRVAESSQENKRESDALSQRQAGSMDRMAVPQGMRTPGPTHGYPPATPSRMLNSQTPNRGQSFGNNSPPIFDPARGGLQNRIRPSISCQAPLLYTTHLQMAALVGWPGQLLIRRYQLRLDL